MKDGFPDKDGLFEYYVILFGLANAPSTFQSYIDKALSHLIDVTVIVYFDNILVYSENVNDHERHVKEVLEALRAHGLC